MKFGISSVNVSGLSAKQLQALGQKAEEVGVESFWTFEHVVVPLDYESTYPYSRDGKMPVTPETPFIDPLISLSYLAGATTTLKLATGVNIMPQVNPLLFAKQVASLDFLSEGRLLLGVGAGWLREEFDAMGVPFEKRGKRFDDYLEAIKKVWSGEPVEHQSEYIQWSGFKSYPLPAQRPHPPLIIGGTSTPALKRVVRHGDGWFAPSRHLKDLTPMMEQLAAEAAKAERDVASLDISAMWGMKKEGLDSIEGYRNLGVNRLILPLHTLGDPVPMVGLEMLGETIRAVNG